jgi:hypothetical protein
MLQRLAPAGIPVTISHNTRQGAVSIGALLLARPCEELVMRKRIRCNVILRSAPMYIFEDRVGSP